LFSGQCNIAIIKAIPQLTDKLDLLIGAQLGKVECWASHAPNMTPSGWWRQVLESVVNLSRELVGNSGLNGSQLPLRGLHEPRHGALTEVRLVFGPRRGGEASSDRSSGGTRTRTRDTEESAPFNLEMIDWRCQSQGRQSARKQTKVNRKQPIGDRISAIQQHPAGSNAWR
jgi:hypothetical protein